MLMGEGADVALAESNDGADAGGVRELRKPGLGQGLLGRRMKMLEGTETARGVQAGGNRGIE